MESPLHFYLAEPSRGLAPERVRTLRRSWAPASARLRALGRGAHLVPPKAAQVFPPPSDAQVLHMKPPQSRAAKVRTLMSSSRGLG